MMARPVVPLYSATAAASDLSDHHAGRQRWTDTPYNVAVGGTDFEDTYNVKKAGASFSTYWSSTNSSGYGSALQYIPEIPWNESCGSALIDQILTGVFTVMAAPARATRAQGILTTCFKLPPVAAQAIALRETVALARSTTWCPTRSAKGGRSPPGSRVRR